MARCGGNFDEKEWGDRGGMMRARQTDQDEGDFFFMVRVPQSSIVSGAFETLTQKLPPFLGGKDGLEKCGCYVG